MSAALKCHGDPIDWLRGCCHATRVGLTYPFRVKWRGKPWACATNARVMLLLERYAVPKREGVPDVVPMLDGYAELFDRRQFVARASDLRMWSDCSDIEPKLVDCGECDGRLRVRCDSCGGERRIYSVSASRSVHCPDCDYGWWDCDFCDKGKVLDPYPPDVFGRLWGRLVDRRQVALVVAGADGMCAVSVDADPLGPVVLNGSGWRAVVMPVRDNGEAARVFPSGWA